MKQAIRNIFHQLFQPINRSCQEKETLHQIINRMTNQLFIQFNFIDLSYKDKNSEEFNLLIIIFRCILEFILKLYERV